MSPTTVSARAARCSIAAVLAVGVFATDSPAQSEATAITGAYNGTDSCPQPRKLKVSLRASSDGAMTGLLTFYLPPAFTQAVTYLLTGRFDARSGRFVATPSGWKDAPPPAGFVAPVLDGTFNPRTESIEGKFTSGPCATFTASKDQDGPAQPDPDRPANTNIGLVHKSQTYWKGFKGDLIRKVFDGNFGVKFGTSTDFSLLFITYVESYSKRCRAYLPDPHVTVTISQSVGTNSPTTSTLEIDPRFAGLYEVYSGSATRLKATALEILLKAGSPDAAMRKILEPLEDMERFFGSAPCQSASMRQLGENLLRAAKDQPSLQQARATIPGASAETLESQRAEEAEKKAADRAEEAERLAADKKIKEYRATNPSWIRYEKEQQEKWGAPRASVGDYVAQWMGKQMHLAGTVASVSIANGTPSWLSMRFQESPNRAFVVCSPSPSIFTGLFGNDLNALVGKKVEVIGSIESPLCGGDGGSIRVVDSDSVRLLR